MPWARQGSGLNPLYCTTITSQRFRERFSQRSSNARSLLFNLVINPKRKRNEEIHLQRIRNRLLPASRRRARSIRSGIVYDQRSRTRCRANRARERLLQRGPADRTGATDTLSDQTPDRVTLLARKSRMDKLPPREIDQ